MFRAAGLIFLVLLAGCTQSQKSPVNQNQNQSPRALMVSVAKQVQTCWFKKKNPALSPYRMASEVNSFSGKPRILIVPKNNPGGLPKLVAQAERIGGGTQFTTFGPLLSTKQGPKLNASLRAWAQGSRTC